METNERVRSFSDDLPPEELCDWLAAKLEAKGLELNEQQRGEFIENEINGLAFRKLTVEDLREMGFKMGPRKNILDIIASLPVEVESPTEEQDGNSIQTMPSYPATGCTMSFSPETTPAFSSEPSQGARAPACMPSRGNLWTKKSLVVELHNENYLNDWKMTPETFLECANRWSTGDVEGGNYIPKFVLKEDNSPDSADIIVEFNKSRDIESDIGYQIGSPTKILLDLSHDDQVYREHLIGHEFGHALGLGHEHQRSDFWQLIEDFIDKDKIKSEVKGQYGDWVEDKHVADGGSTDYDPESIMHYWFAREWLKDGYSDEKTIMAKITLSDRTKHALLGILRRHRRLASRPSKVDLKFLSDQYNTQIGPGIIVMPQDVHDVPPARGSEHAPKRIKEDSGSDIQGGGSKGKKRVTEARGPEPTPKRIKLVSGSDMQGSRNGRNTPEYKKIKKNFPNLARTIAKVIDSVCQELVAEDLITDNQRSEAGNALIGANKRANALVSLILNRVELDTQNFQTFITILRNNFKVFRPVLVEMGIDISDLE